MGRRVAKHTMTIHHRLLPCSAPCCPGPRERPARGSGRELIGARATPVPGAKKGGRVAKSLNTRFRDQVRPRLGLVSPIRGAKDFRYKFPLAAKLKNEIIVLLVKLLLNSATA